MTNDPNGPLPRSVPDRKRDARSTGFRLYRHSPSARLTVRNMRLAIRDTR